MQAPSYYLSRMRENRPLIQNITNFVAMERVANTLLASGASPAMVHALEEVEEFAHHIAGLSINIGTLNAERIPAMEKAAQTASALGKPWVLDPVAAGAISFRLQTALKLCEARPSVIRGNASEILALCYGSAHGKGIDAHEKVEQAQEAAKILAIKYQAVIAVTGAIDFITNGVSHYEIVNGHPLMAKVTALGCSLTGLIAAFLGSNNDDFQATIAAISYYGLAGERAAKIAKGPGSFGVNFLDALAGITAEILDEGAKIS